MARVATRLNGDRLRELRVARTMSQEDLAHKLKCSKRTLEKAEKGQPISLEIAKKISKLFGADAGILAEPPRATSSLSYLDRRRLESPHFPLMMSVAKMVASSVGRGAALAVSSGVTVALAVAEMARADKRPLIVTNNVGVVDELSRYSLSASVTLAGGEYYPWIHACVGKDAVRCFRRIRIPIALLGLSGITSDGRMFVLYHDDVPVYDAILASVTDQIIIACDVSKFLHEKVFPLGSLSEWSKEKAVRIVTNHYSQLENETDRKIAESNLESLQERLPTNFSIEFADRPQDH